MSKSKLTCREKTLVSHLTNIGNGGRINVDALPRIPQVPSSDIRKGSRNDEFRASYMAAKNAPNPSDLDRKLLILDAIERAKTAGMRINLNNFMRRIVYGE